ncbi:AraC family transcriptional regulator [Paenibacillaceae bacterium]|nr:AraC family transcriptional regulator [Paenibacillaceae bacterium]
MNRLMEFSNQSSLDHLNINVRWLKEWRLQAGQLSFRHEINQGSFLFPYTAIWLVLDGTAYIELNRNNYTVRAGDIVCISPQTLLTWKSLSESQGFHYLSFACEAKVGMFDFIRLYQFPFVALSTGKEQFDHLVTLWRQLTEHYEAFLDMFEPGDLKTHELEPERDYPALMLDTDQTMLHLLLRSGSMNWMLELFRALRPSLPDHPVAYDTRVFEICQYVEERLSNPPSLEELAGRVSLSKEQLRTLFQAALGLSPMRYVRQVRLQRAKDLLTLTTDPIKEIAAQIGFEDQHHFSRAFQQSEQMSPLEYRRRQKRSNGKTRV